jgi:protein-S-isoprenylcysteine O-methyltransferase Ste14
MRGMMSRRLETDRLGRIVDISEIPVLIILFGWQVYRVAPSLAHSPYNLALLTADALPILVLLWGRSAAVGVSRSPADWLLAFFATAAPMFLAPGGDPAIPVGMGAGMLTVGLLINLAAKAWLWRSFGLVAANRGVRASGPYAVVRHPMYLSYAITQVAFIALNPTMTNVALSAAGFALQLLRLRAEEQLLVLDPVYREYMRVVPYRLAPGIF